MDAPRFDDGLAPRLTARFGPAIGAWLADLPAVLAALADRWHLTDRPRRRRGVGALLVEEVTGHPLAAYPSPERVASLLTALRAPAVRTSPAWSRPRLATRLAGASGLDAGRLLDWCVAFAAMTALELAELPDSPPEHVHARLALTSRRGT